MSSTPIYRSPRDIRILFPHTGTGTHPFILADARDGVVVKRFSSEEDRTAYLARNGYTA